MTRVFKLDDIQVTREKKSRSRPPTESISSVYLSLSLPRKTAAALPLDPTLRWNSFESSLHFLFTWRWVTAARARLSYNTKDIPESPFLGPLASATKRSEKILRFCKYISLWMYKMIHAESKRERDSTQHFLMTSIGSARSWLAVSTRGTRWGDFYIIYDCCCCCCVAVVLCVLEGNGFFFFSSIAERSLYDASNASFNAGLVQEY